MLGTVRKPYESVQGSASKRCTTMRNVENPDRMREVAVPTTFAELKDALKEKGLKRKIVDRYATPAKEAEDDITYAAPIRNESKVAHTVTW